MTFEIKDYFETPVILEPRVELYTVYDFMVCPSRFRGQ